MARLRDGLQYLFLQRRLLKHDHVRARHHHFTDLRFRNLNYAEQHRALVVVEEYVAPALVAEELGEVIARCRLALENAPEATGVPASRW